MSSNNSETPTPAAPLQIADYLDALNRRARLLVRAMLAAAGLTLLGAGLFYIWQPVGWSAYLEFKPVFAGATLGKYPNDLVFTPDDITERLIVDQVYERNRISEYCSREAFRGGFVVKKTSIEMEFLAMDYQARMSDLRISSAERQRLQEEYQTKRALLPPHFRLTFLRSPLCQRMPPVVGSKVLSDVLEQWARDSDDKRGVLKLRVTALAPRVFDVDPNNKQSLLVEADTLRTTIGLVIGNVRQVQALPGAELVRLGEGENRMGFAEIEHKLADLVQDELEPLIAIAGRALGVESRQFVEHALEAATIDYQSALKSAETYRTALELFSGRNPNGVPAQPARQAQSSSPSDVQALTPQVDRSFIDRIVELSTPSAMYRQGTTTLMIRESMRAISLRRNVDHYQSLLRVMRSDSSSQLPGPEVRQRIDALRNLAKVHTQQFNQLYDEFAKIALLPGPQMYNIDVPTVTSVSGTMSLRGLVTIVVGVLLAVPLLLALGIVVFERFRRRTPVEAS